MSIAILDHVVDDHEVPLAVRVAEEQDVALRTLGAAQLGVERDPLGEVHRDEVQRPGMDEPVHVSAVMVFFGPVPAVAHGVVGGGLTVDQDLAVRLLSLLPFRQRSSVPSGDRRVLHEHVAVGVQVEARLVRVPVPPPRVPALGCEEDVAHLVEPGPQEHVPGTPLTHVPSGDSPVGAGEG